MSEFAKRLRLILYKRHMTQAEMAKLIEVAPGTLSAYLREGEGRKVPTLDTLERIAEKLNVSIGWLCGEEVRRTPNYLEIKPSELSYEKLFEIIDTLRELKKKNGEYFFTMLEQERQDLDGFSLEGYCLFSSDSVLYEYYRDLQRIQELYHAGTIDYEMFDAWREKRLKKYADKLVELDTSDELPF